MNRNKKIKECEAKRNAVSKKLKTMTDTREILKSVRYFERMEKEAQIQRMYREHMR